MKRTAVICSLAIAVFGLLTGCNSPFSGAREEEPNLIISLVGANARFTYPPSDADLAETKAVLVVTKEGAAEGITQESDGDRSFSVRVEPGEYTIMLSVFHKNGVLLAKMAAPEKVTVEPNKVTQKGVSLERQFTVAGVTVSPSVITVAPGGTRQFSATVTISEALPQDVTWKVTAAAPVGVTLKAGTTISAGGELKVDAVEDATSLTITATSALENVFHNVTVTVGAPSPDPLPPDAKVTVKGDYWVGEVLEAELSSSFSSGGTLTYEWKAGGVTNSGATGSTYTLGSGDVGKIITVEVTNTAFDGTIAGALTRTVILPPLPSDAAATISGTSTVFQTLTANLTGFWSDGTGVIYQWKRNGEDITIGGTSETYILQAADAGTVISVEVSHGDYSGSRTAKIAGTVALATLTGTVSISPNTGVDPGTQLTATYSGSVSGLSYQWNRSGAAISGATGQTYTPTAVGSYTVTVRATGYNPKTSAAVSVALSFFDVYNQATWDAAAAAISAGGNGTSTARKAYTINITGNFTRTSNTSASFGSVTYVDVTINGGNRTITLSGTGNLLRVGVNQAIVMNNLNLAGNATNTAGLVYVGGGSAFTMNGGKISGNTADNGGGVSIYGSGTFTMNGGEISGNTANNGGGVSNNGSGTFTMNGGEISGNIATGSNSGGGGVYVASGTFTMTDGVVSGNKSTGAFSSGGGVFVNTNGTFNMTGGTVSGNTAGRIGGGVAVNVNGGTFRISNGTVYGMNEGTTLSNTVTNNAENSAALHAWGTAERGTFATPGVDSTWTKAGDLATSNATIRVVNGALQ